jgi:hypothetical protein
MSKLFEINRDVQKNLRVLFLKELDLDDNACISETVSVNEKTVFGFSSGFALLERSKSVRFCESGTALQDA